MQQVGYVGTGHNCSNCWFWNRIWSDSLLDHEFTIGNNSNNIIISADFKTIRLGEMQIWACDPPLHKVLSRLKQITMSKKFDIMLVTLFFIEPDFIIWSALKWMGCGGGYAAT